MTKGWKANPVDYDHVLARAKYAWSFGAPEIVDLFSGPNVHGQHYSAEMIDFAAKDAKTLDQWSFDRLRELLEAASVDAELAGKLKSDQVVIFVHLLGLDTNGHAFKPHSREYLENVEFVDAGIKTAVEQLETFYGNDGQTAYIYTADHGMSDAGTHGDGDPDNTRTPFVAWGAGVSEPQAASLGLKDDHDAYSSNWGLGDYRRRDINQADLTPFMAALAGLPVPVNSEGVLPIKLLGTSQEHRCRALLDNAKQILAGYETKERLKAAKEPFFTAAPVPAAQVKAALDQAAQLIEGKQFAEAQRLSFATIKDGLSGLAFLHKYDGTLLKSICVAGYLGWIFYTLVFMARNYYGAHYHEGENSIATLAFACGYVLFSAYLLVKKSPLQYHLYFLFATSFWYKIAQSRAAMRMILTYPFMSLNRLPAILAYIAGLELLVLTFFQRQVLAGVNVILAFAQLFRFGRQNTTLSLAWFISCLAMSAFPFLAPIKLADDTLYVAGTITNVFVALVGYHLIRPARKAAFLARLFLIGMAGYLAKASDLELKAKTGLPQWNQNAAWIILASSILSPIVNSLRKGQHCAPMTRLLDLFMTMAPAYILLSIAYEPLFYAAFAVQLALWILLESRSSEKRSSTLSLEHLWIVFGFLFFVNLAFFGTGNMASISSFTLESVYRFITVFAPFPMAALLVLKLLLPFVLLSAAFGVLSHRSGTPAFSLVLLVLATTDLMTLNFFFLVRDHGSWLEIGTSISHFVISSSLIVFTLMLAGLAGFLMTGVKWEEHNTHCPAENAFTVEGGRLKIN